jgi:hypothetical protein
MNNHHLGLLGHGSDSSDVACDIEIELVVKCRVYRRRSVDHQQRVAVRRGTYDCLGTDIATAAGRFSTTNCWSNRSDSHCAVRRARMSVGPPAANDTIIFTGRDG